MKSISADDAFIIAREIRDVLNQYEGTKGCDAVVLCFIGDVDGLKLAHIKINNPPELVQTIDALVQYLAMHAYNAGIEAGLERASNIIKAPTIQPSAGSNPSEL
jgi:hypothetical protein